jgi:cation diffusion facilitator family transporter
LGVKHWTAPPDDKHPYGHQRFESIVTTFIGVILVLVALGLGYNALISLQKQEAQVPLLIAVIAPAVSIVIKEILFQRTIRIGRKTKSSALVANAWHHRSDVLSSIPPLLAITVSAIDEQWAFLDRVAAIIVSLFILKVSLDILKPVFGEITETGLPREEISRIKEEALSIPEIKDVHKIRSRRIGSDVYVDLHIQVDGNLTVREGHALSEMVSRRLIDEFSDLIDVVTHLEPFSS